MIVQRPYPRGICVTTDDEGDWIMFTDLSAKLERK
jgi:hypothetical protein